MTNGTMGCLTPMNTPPALVAAVTTKTNCKVKWENITLSPTATESLELPAVMAAAMLEYHEMADRPLHMGVDCTVMERIFEASKQRARSRGSAVVSPRDVADAAREMDGTRAIPPSPAEALPVHYDRLVQPVAELASSRS